MNRTEESFYEGDEPIRGLPARLPMGESILWQGEPSWRGMALRMFHVRKLAMYFAIIFAWNAISMLRAGDTVEDTLVGLGKVAGLAGFVIGTICLFCYLVSRTTVYTITSRRVVIRAGIALSKTINIPFVRVASADFRQRPDGGGDIILTPMAEDRIAYFVLWPHTQSWHLAQARPMLRAVSDVAGVAKVLGEALAADGQGGAVQTPSQRPGVARPMGGRAAVAA